MSKNVRKGCLGILFPNIDQTFALRNNDSFYRIWNGFREGAGEFGYDVIFLNNRNGNREVTYAQYAQQFECKGVLLSCAGPDGIKEAIRILDAGFPAVSLDHRFDKCSFICSDDERGIRELVQYVFSQGHRKIGLLHFDPVRSVRKKIRSFCDACEEMGFRAPEEYIRHISSGDLSSVAQATRELITLEDRPTCLFYPDDFSSIGGIDTMVRLGVKVPEEIGIIGYESLGYGQQIDPKLTAYRPNAELIGTKAAEELVRTIEAGEDHVPQKIVVPGEIFIGNTVIKAR